MKLPGVFEKWFETVAVSTYYDKNWFWCEVTPVAEAHCTPRRMESTAMIAVGYGKGSIAGLVPGQELVMFVSGPFGVYM